MKTKLAIFLLVLVGISCSSDDSGIERRLLYGQWFSVGLCASQNNLVLNSDGTYIRTYSGNTCEDNALDTFQSTGTYKVKGNNISFEENTNVVIEEGEDNAITVPNLILLLHQKIRVLNESQLIIELKYRSDTVLYSNVSYVR